MDILEMLDILDFSVSMVFSIVVLDNLDASLSRFLA